MLLKKFSTGTMNTYIENQLDLGIGGIEEKLICRPPFLKIVIHMTWIILTLWALCIYYCWRHSCKIYQYTYQYRVHDILSKYVVQTDAKRVKCTI